METKDHKKAIQQSDQMFCAWCGKAWDVNDPNPPECSDKPPSREILQIGQNRDNYRHTVEAAIETSVYLREGATTPRYTSMQGVAKCFSDAIRRSISAVPQAYYLQRRGVGFVVWANGPKEAYNYAVRVGMRPTYMRRIDIPDRAYEVKTPRAEINPLTLELVRSRYPNFGEVVTPVQFVSRQKEKRK